MNTVLHSIDPSYTTYRYSTTCL